MKMDKELKRKVFWSVLLGLGIAGVINTIIILALGIGNVHLGNLLPAMVGAVLALISGIKMVKGAQFRLIPWPWARKTAKAICALSLVWIMILMGLMQWGWSRAQVKETEWMVIAGAGLRGYNLSLTLKNRLDTGLKCWLQNPKIKIIVSGGQGADEPISEGKAMYDYLIQMGVPPEQVFVEDKSTSTFENILFSKKVLDASGYHTGEKVLMVTSQYHMYRTIHLAELNGLNAVGVAAPTPLTVRLGGYLREFLALTKHLLTGR